MSNQVKLSPVSGQSYRTPTVACTLKVGQSYRTPAVTLSPTSRQYIAPASSTLYTYPTGIYDHEFGSSEVSAETSQLAYPGGFDAAEFGTASLGRTTRPTSWDSSQLPAGANVYNFNKQITAYPFTGQPEAPPSPVVYNLLQRVYSGYVATAFVAGTAWVSNYYRAMRPNGAAHAVFGTQNVYLGRRYIGPAYLPGTQTSFGTPFVAWENRDVLPVWGDTSTFGTALVRDRAQRAYPAGRPSALAFGIPLVRDRAQRAYPFALLSSEYGTGFLLSLIHI